MLITGTFPRDWKSAEVSPILKGGDFEEAGNNIIGQSLLRKGGPKTASSLPDRKRKAGSKPGLKQKVALH